jgi:predicted nucleic acid-binding protein
MIVADTGAVVALIDADARHHRALRSAFERDPEEWVLPWAVLPEVDYLLGAHVGQKSEEAFLLDVASGAFTVEWGAPADLAAAQRFCKRHRSLRLGLVDGVVIAIAERLEATAIATLDVRHFAAVRIRGDPRLLPRDL